MNINPPIKLSPTRNRSPKCPGWQYAPRGVADGNPSRSNKSYFRTRLYGGFFYGCAHGISRRQRGWGFWGDRNTPGLYCTEPRPSAWGVLSFAALALPWAWPLPCVWRGPSFLRVLFWPSLSWGPFLSRLSFWLQPSSPAPSSSPAL